MATAATTTYQCDSCNHEVSGYSKRDLLDEGWQWHDAGAGRLLVICGDCEKKYTSKRANSTANAA